jgi:hypothetical protein
MSFKRKFVAASFAASFGAMSADALAQPRGYLDITNETPGITRTAEIARGAAGPRP